MSKRKRDELQKKMDELLRYNPGLEGHLDAAKFGPQINIVSQALAELNSKSITSEIDAEKSGLNADREALSEALRDRSTTVLALQYLSIYNIIFYYIGFTFCAFFYYAMSAVL